MESEFFSTSSTFRLCFEGGFARKEVLEGGMRFSSIEGLFRWDWIFLIFILIEIIRRRFLFKLNYSIDYSMMNRIICKFLSF